MQLPLRYRTIEARSHSAGLFLCAFEVRAATADPVEE